jgi:phospholipid N-methyltransferase
MSLRENLAFFSQTLKQFQTTGALVPSSPSLARAMAWPLRQPRKHPWSILEVGPGTGSFTRQLAGSMGEKDRLDCYELNEHFHHHLSQRLKTEPHFQVRGRQINLLHQDIRKLPAKARYDLVLSGLPFNNFPPELVSEIMAILYRALKPGATLVYFEYLLLRKAKSAALGGQERRRLAAIESVLNSFHAKGTSRDEVVWMNLPPARVRSLTKPLK